MISVFSFLAGCNLYCKYRILVNLFEPWNNSKLVKRDVVINEILQRANAFLLPTKRETREIELSVVFPLVDRWTLIHEKCI